MQKLRALVGHEASTKHGECFIWDQAENHHRIAVDAGGTKSVGQQGGGYKPDILILTHQDEDHIGGALELIRVAGKTLAQLWVPVEWVILVNQIAITNADNFWQNPTVDELVVESDLVTRIADVEPSDAPTQDLMAKISRARESLDTWKNAPYPAGISTSIQTTSDSELPLYGAANVGRAIKTVKSKASALIEIFEAAHANKTRVRFFSIDLALSRNDKNWETEGEPGRATLANASEAPDALAIYSPPGFAYSFALNSLSTQNRRALCTLLWRESDSPVGGALIWSDSDGNWLDVLGGSGMSQIVGSLSASSAPHHASANMAHDRAWRELKHAPKNMVMISAGGMSGQSYEARYVALGTRRSCTWCRPNPALVGDVVASGSPANPLQLDRQCHSIAGH